jgi:rSAM/selenodomain-associated transferase 2
MSLAVVVPVLNEERTIRAALARLVPLHQRGATVIVVDGGSDDDTVALASSLADRVLCAPRGRAAQMNAGARHALTTPSVDTVLFLHADTRLPDAADILVAEACRDRASAWGRFDVAIEGRAAALPLVAMTMNLRSRLTGICTGDQCIFMTRAMFDATGGFAAIPLMEDIDFSRRARRLARPIALRPRAVTSGRRWERNGVLRTVMLMWRLRVAFFLGADPARLAAMYRDAR